MADIQAKLIGNNLLRIRSKLNMSQSEAGRRAGLSPQHVSAMEAGKLGVPKLDSLMKLATVYDCSLYDIIYYPVANDNRVNDAQGTYRSNTSKIIDILKQNPHLINFFSVQLDFLSIEPLENMPDLIELFSEIIKLPPAKRKALVSMLNNFK